jgi:8-oxo-dGTP diphosphatase
MEFVYKYPRMLVTVDALVFLKEPSNQTPKILLIQRKNNPYKGYFALPGGFVEMCELLKDAVTRELFEESGLQGVELTQLAAFDKIDRDPRDRNICIAYYGFTTPENAQVNGGDDAEKAEWFSIDNLPVLAFDHSDVIKFAIRKLNLT